MTPRPLAPAPPRGAVSLLWGGRAEGVGNAESLLGEGGLLPGFGVGALPLALYPDLYCPLDVDGVGRELVNDALIDRRVVADAVLSPLVQRLAHGALRRLNEPGNLRLRLARRRDSVTRFVAQFGEAETLASAHRGIEDRGHTGGEEDNGRLNLQSPGRKVAARSSEPYRFMSGWLSSESFRYDSTPGTMPRARTVRQSTAYAFGSFRYREAQDRARMTADERATYDAAQARRADQIRRNVQTCHACGQETPNVINGAFSFACQRCGADLLPF